MLSMEDRQSLFYAAMQTRNAKSNLSAQIALLTSAARASLSSFDT